MSISKFICKRSLAAVCALVCLLACIWLPAGAAKKEIPDFCMPILQDWGATNEKELQDAILSYWKDNMPMGWNEMHKDAQKPLSFCLWRNNAGADQEPQEVGCGHRLL